MQGALVETIDLQEIRASLRSAATARTPSDEGRIEKRPGAVGNKAVFAGTRTPVDSVLVYLRRSIPDSEVLEAFPHLTEADLAAARRLTSA